MHILIIIFFYVQSWSSFQRTHSRRTCSDFRLILKNNQVKLTSAHQTDAWQGEVIGFVCVTFKNTRKISFAYSITHHHIYRHDNSTHRHHHHKRQSSIFIIKRDRFEWLHDMSRFIVYRTSFIFGCRQKGNVRRSPDQTNLSTILILKNTFESQCMRKIWKWCPVSQISTFFWNVLLIQLCHRHLSLLLQTYSQNNAVNIQSCNFLVYLLVHVMRIQDVNG